MLYNIIVLKPSIFFHVTHDCVTVMVTLVTVTYNIMLFFFFFLNHQFITWHTKVDRGSYFRNYVHRKQTQRKIKKKEKEKEKKQDIRTNRRRK